MPNYQTCFAGVCAAMLVFASTAEAHVALRSPTPRLAGDEGGTALKNAPCGQTTNERTTNVSEFAPGETITVTIDEFIPHPGYFRVAFDDDGDDGFPVRANMDSVDAGTDPATENPVDGMTVLAYSDESGSGGEHTIEVTLPNIECDNCTLQVIQFMTDKLGNGQDDEYYHQCADLVLTGDGGGAGGATSTTSTTATMGGASSTTGDDTTTTTDSGMGGTSSATTTGAMGVGGATATGTTGDASTTMAGVATTGGAVTSAGMGGTTASGATTGSTSAGVGGSGLGDPVGAEPASDEGGCSCRMLGAPASGGLALAPFALGVWWARRRR